ncbi:DUF4194 domain-containing protein [Candidatus Phytoplasma pini]|uniref:DUF4194 domain-containing protein n=1 Tax=Candidatus Phytoplasma pini TaxID=267362 RepID=A0A559KJK9_9MOLU|nr:DUF4194 domain-containing protein [Candidatus Phytoplasma pini]TVY12323.1 hypothetical protein MDPP_0096 [Candidatus Phytoplasma pini]
MEHKLQCLKEFCKKFEFLKEQEQNLFSKIINKLLQVNYLTAQKSADINDYHFLLLHKEIFIFFLQLLDFELKIEKQDEVIFIKNLNHFNKLKLKKEESLILLILRILFQQKKENLGNYDKVTIYLQNIYQELTKISYVEIKKLTKEKMKNILVLFRRYNIIDYSDNDYLLDNLIIIIYPSILYIIDLKMVQQYKELIDNKLK